MGTVTRTAADDGTGTFDAADGQELARILVRSGARCEVHARKLSAELRRASGFVHHGKRCGVRTFCLVDAAAQNISLWNMICTRRGVICATRKGAKLIERRSLDHVCRRFPLRAMMQTVGSRKRLKPAELAADSRFPISSRRVGQRIKKSELERDAGSMSERGGHLGSPGS